LLALLGARHILHVGRIRVKLHYWNYSADRRSHILSSRAAMLVSLALPIQHTACSSAMACQLVQHFHSTRGELCVP